MRPETREAIQELLTAMERFKQDVGNEQAERVMDELMFCVRNCYTKKEIESQMTSKFPPSGREQVRIFFQRFLGSINEESRKAYLREAEECEDLRHSELRDVSEEAKKDQGEASTSHTCERNCKV